MEFPEFLGSNPRVNWAPNPSLSVGQFFGGWDVKFIAN